MELVAWPLQTTPRCSIIIPDYYLEERDNAIWFDIEDMREFTDEAIVRYGIIRHGRLGWTAPQLANGIEGKLHARRPDGAPLVASGA